MLRAALRSASGWAVLTGGTVAVGAAAALTAHIGSDKGSITSCEEDDAKVPVPPPLPFIVGTVQTRRLFRRPSCRRPGGARAGGGASDPVEMGRQRRALLLREGGILLIPGVLSADECGSLRDETDRILDHEAYRRDRYVDDADEEGGDDDDEEEEGEDESSLRRVSLVDMSTEARGLSDLVLKERVLPALRRDVPCLLEELGLGSFDSPRAKYEWAADEPSINRYTAGGRFDPHRDGYALTVIVLLSEEGAFRGGGTRFFDLPERGAAAAVDGGTSVNLEPDSRQVITTESSKSASTLVQPPQGTAILFGGDITHAGSPVVSGTRHLFVASFGVAD